MNKYTFMIVMSSINLLKPNASANYNKNLSVNISQNETPIFEAKIITGDGAQPYFSKQCKVFLDRVELLFVTEQDTIHKTIQFKVFEQRRLKSDMASIREKTFKANISGLSNSKTIKQDEYYRTYRVSPLPFTGEVVLMDILNYTLLWNKSSAAADLMLYTDILCGPSFGPFAP